ncbi:hypothetical protein H4V99_001312 [Cryobacterium sp. CG_9.6]|nr:hypothetical protein [Cryobacterium sp. CG_9.6]
MTATLLQNTYVLQVAAREPGHRRKLTAQIHSQTADDTTTLPPALLLRDDLTAAVPGQRDHWRANDPLSPSQYQTETTLTCRKADPAGGLH